MNNRNGCTTTIRAERNHIEGEFGQGKRGYGLNNVKVRLKDTSESWINAIFFVMNLQKLLQIPEKAPVFFVHFLEIYRSTEIYLKNYFLRKYFTPKVQIELCAA